MRLGASKRIKAVRLEEKREVLDFAARIVSPADTIYVGLVGGRDPASMTVRLAQSFLRFDRRPSYFSHVFLFTGRGDAILECRLVGADPSRPETQGVVRDRARRYQDAEDWPNKALIGFTFREVKGGDAPSKRVKSVLDAATDSRKIRERYDVWSMIAAWQPYLFEPHRHANPLVERSPHPGAAFVRWALGMAGIEGSPGALDELDAPEHLWAAANYWYEAYAKSVAVTVSLVRDITDQAGTVSLPE